MLNFIKMLLRLMGMMKFKLERAWEICAVLQLCKSRTSIHSGKKIDRPPVINKYLVKTILTKSFLRFSNLQRFTVQLIFLNFHGNRYTKKEVSYEKLLNRKIVFIFSSWLKSLKTFKMWKPKQPVVYRFSNN